jgi:hypothetical protein
MEPDNKAGCSQVTVNNRELLADSGKREKTVFVYAFP